MTASRRWMKFWPQDWQRDPALRSCGAAARGLWMDLICIAHEGEPYGHVTINGKAATAKQLGSITGTGEKEATRLIAELEAAGVFSRSDEGTIFSRRMVRDNAASDAGREAIGKRWSDASSTKKVSAVTPIRNPNGTANTNPIRGGDSLEAEAEKKDSELRSAPDGAASLSVREALWRDGVPILRALIGLSDSRSRAFLGGLLKRSHDDGARVYTILREAESLRPADPAAWLTKAATPQGERETNPEPTMPTEANPRGAPVSRMTGTW